MKVHIYLTKEGLEDIVMQGTPYSWNYAVREEGVRMENSVWIGDAEVMFPSREKCTAGAIALLKKKQQEAYITAEKEAKGYEGRIQSMLALPAPDVVPYADR